MCGIVGYIGNKNAPEILLDSLSKLEYRGYDSAGIAVENEKGKVEVIKEKGKLINLKEKVEKKNPKGSCGIGHTRWATHGVPSKVNAHPHASNDKSITLVHNGIIENYQELRDKLTSKGYEFSSSTDTEVLVNLIDYYYKKYNIGPVDAIAKTMVRVRGSYAIAILFKDYPGQIWAARKDSPMVIGISEGNTYLASDVPAILKYTKDVYYIDNLEMACLQKGEVEFYNLNGDVVKKDKKTIDWDVSAAEKEGFEHFMIKEIYEQPEVLRKTLGSSIENGKINIEKIGLNEEIINSLSKIHVVACGSAYHVGVVGKYAIEKLARIPVDVDIASEFRYRNPILDKNDLVIIISQSGETADSLAALREAKNKGVKTLAIVNVVGSSIAREADFVYYTVAGPEIAVATTKAYSAQLMTMELMAIEFGRIKNTISAEDYAKYIKEIEKIPEEIENILANDKGKIQKLSSNFANTKDAFFIGRSFDYALSLEGSLKLKEVSYIHCEAYAAGELKHGTISLIEKDTLVIGIVTQDDLAEKTISNLVEVKSRGAKIIGVTSKEYIDNKAFEDTIEIPETLDFLYPMLVVVPLQLLSYYVTIVKGFDPDKPRNLAKSVTVE